MKKNLIRICLLLLPGCAALLNALPKAVMLRFAGPEQSFYEYFSGFDLLPVGYAVWGPMLAGVSAAILAVLGAIALYKPTKTLKKWMLGLAAFGCVMSLSPMILGTLTPIGGIVATLLAAEAVTLWFFK
ncbi:MAG: hypothetical protein E7439_01830 [Ruminococcaceae bacterium]|nr:hypothetical protein [Oscillospiraceae bacterium]